MNKKQFRNVISILLLLMMVVCFTTGMIKWPFLIQSLGVSYRDLPMALITDVHDWSGLVAGVLTVLHCIQYRNLIRKMIHGT